MKNSDCQAFPLVGVDSGLTKREYFAGLALKSIGHHFGSGFNDSSGYSECSRQCVFMADALLKELNDG